MSWPVAARDEAAEFAQTGRERLMATKHSLRNWFSNFDFLATLAAVLFGPGEPVLKPIPVRVRRRR